MKFGPFGEDENLVETLRDDLSQDAWNKLAKEFSDGGSGGVEFSHSGMRQTLYYAPVSNTGWVLTILVADNLIQDQVLGISSEMIMRSAVQIVVTALALLAYFGAIIAHSRKKSATLLEVERQHTRDAGERAQRSERELGEVRQIAYTDALTGARSKFAYVEEESKIDEAIRKGGVSDFAVVVCDVNGLKHVNDTLGHAAGDEYIRAAYDLVRGFYAQSPIFRIGGDEFVVIVQNDEYARREEILAELNSVVEQNIKRDEVVVAAGMAEYMQLDEQLYATFHRADQRMYARKAQLKELGAKTRD